MAFSDELSYDVWLTRTLRDQANVFADTTSWTLQTGSGTSTSASATDKQGAVWRQEIYHGRRVDRQKVLV